METRAHYVTIGGFVMAVLAVGFLFVYWLHSSQNSSDRVKLQVRFPGAVTGLATGAAVYFNGIRIGQVSQLSFAGDGSTEVVATADVDSQAPLKQDVKATLGFQGLTGLAYIQLTGGSKDSPPLLVPGETPMLVADRSAFEDLLEGARDIMKKADTTLTSIEQVVTENAGRVSDTINNIQQFSDALAQNSDSVRTLFTDVGGAARTIAELSDQAKTIVGQVESIIDAVPPEKITEVVDDIAVFSGSLRRAGNQVDGVFREISEASAKLGDFVDGLNGALASVDTILQAVPADAVTRIVQGADTLISGLADHETDITDFIVSAKGAAASIDQIAADLAARKDDIDAVITDVRTFTGKANEIASGLAPAIADVGRIVAAVDPTKVETIVSSLDTVTSGFAAHQGDINELIVSAKGAAASIDQLSADFAARKDDIDAIITDVRTFTGKANELATGLAPAIADVGRIVAAVDPAKVETIVSSLDTVTSGVAAHQTDINDFIVSAKSAAASVDQIASDFAARKDDIDVMITNLRTLSDRANELAVGLTPAVADLGRILAAVDSTQVEAIVRNVDTVTARLAAKTDAIDGTIDDIRSAAAATRQFVDGVAAKSGAVDAAIDDGQQMMARLNDASVKVNEILGEADKMLKGDGQGLIVELTGAARAIRIIAEDFQPRASAIATGLARFSTTGLSDLTDTIDQARQTLIVIQNAVNSLDRDPSRVIFGGTGQPTYTPQRR